MGKADDTTIRFSGLKPGRYNYAFTLGKAFFDEQENDEIEEATVEIGIEMERLERMLIFHFRLSGRVTTYCDRCLDPLIIPIEGEETLSVRFSDTEKSESENETVLTESAVEIDLTPWLYEYVTVRIPMQHVHATVEECNAEMGRYLEHPADQPADESVDPRWEALKKLK